jgi:hypothetical protein
MFTRSPGTWITGERALRRVLTRWMGPKMYASPLLILYLNVVRGVSNKMVDILNKYLILTSWSTVLEKLTGFQLTEKALAFNGIILKGYRR